MLQRGGGALQKRLEQEDREEEQEDTAGEDDDSTQVVARVDIEQPHHTLVSTAISLCFSKTV